MEASRRGSERAAAKPKEVAGGGVRGRALGGGGGKESAHIPTVSRDQIYS